MVSAANTALDLGIFQVVLLLLVLALVLCGSLPVRRGPEYDVLSNAGGITLWSGGLALLLSELGPCLPLCDVGVDNSLDNGLLDAPGSLDLLSILAY